MKQLLYTQNTIGPKQLLVWWDNIRILDSDSTETSGETGARTVDFHRLLRLLLLLPSLVLVSAQIQVLGPPPLPQTEARQQIKELLETIGPGNSQETVKTLTHLALWYRDLVDEELIAAWRKDDRAKLTGIMPQLANENVAAGVIRFSWRDSRITIFAPAFEPVLEDLIFRYGDSAKSFADDLLATPPPDLTRQEAETVCRILLNLRDAGDWKHIALHVLPRYKDITTRLLNADLGDPGKRDRAQLWLYDLGWSSPFPNSRPRKRTTPPSPTGPTTEARPSILREPDPANSLEEGHPSSSAADAFRELSPEMVLGSYRRDPVLNPWHQGVIQWSADGKTLAVGK